MVALDLTPFEIEVKNRLAVLFDVSAENIRNRAYDRAWIVPIESSAGCKAAADKMNDIAGHHCAGACASEHIMDGICIYRKFGDNDDGALAIILSQWEAAKDDIKKAAATETSQDIKTFQAAFTQGKVGVMTQIGNSDKGMFIKPPPKQR